MKMKTKGQTTAIACIAALVSAATSPADQVRPEDVTTEAPAEGQAKVQLAILLDTSGSMSGLIEQTKT